MRFSFTFILYPQVSAHYDRLLLLQSQMTSHCIYID